MNGIKFRKIAYHIFTKVYHYLVISALFGLSILAGLGFFTLIPALVTSFYIIKRLRREIYKQKVKIFSLYKKNIIINLKKYWLASLTSTLLVFFVSFDILYFNLGIYAIFTYLFYVFIILDFFILTAISLGSYLLACGYKLGIRDLVKNIVSIIIVNFIDILFLSVASVALALILENISAILIIILVPSIYIDFASFIYQKILDKKSITYYLFNLK